MEVQQILTRIQPRLIALGMPAEDIREVMTRLAMTEITVLREIERDGIPEVAKRVQSTASGEKVKT